MSGTKAIILLSVLAVAYGNEYAEKMCRQLPAFTTFRDLNSCEKYYICSETGPKEASCLKGLYFDKESGKCLEKSRVKCNLDFNEKCLGKNSVYLKNDLSCDSYYICINGEAQEAKCPKDTVFNPKISACVNSNEYKCTVQQHSNVNICQLIPQKVLFANTDNCKQYKICVGDKSFDRSCPGSLHFDYLSGKCDVKAKAKCGKNEATPAFERPEMMTTCGSKSKPFVGLVSDDKTCRGYYKCEHQVDRQTNKQIVDPRPKLMKCPKTEIFDQEKRSCQPRENTKCRFDRCDGWGNDLVNIENDGCKGYIMCQDNVELLRSECPAKHFFDEKKQDCVVEKVTYKSCKKA